MRRKHVPQRTCVGCRQVRPKREMVRIVRTPNQGVQIDESGKKSGRGAYLCRNRGCWETALGKRCLEHALKIALTDEECSALQAFSQSLEDGWR
ncbi:MAG: RNase P modulator RnpM [Anaerolineae bacterium]